MVPESQDTVALQMQIFGSDSIRMDLGGMLATINLHDQAVLNTTEVSNVAADGMLAAKFRAFDLTGSETCPQLAFRICLFMPEAPCETPG
jgi:hypothetical protein